VLQHGAEKAICNLAIATMYLTNEELMQINAENLKCTKVEEFDE